MLRATTGPYRNPLKWDPDEGQGNLTPYNGSPSSAAVLAVLICHPQVGIPCQSPEVSFRSSAPLPRCSKTGSSIEKNHIKTALFLYTFFSLINVHIRDQKKRKKEKENGSQLTVAQFQNSFLIFSPLNGKSRKGIAGQRKQGENKGMEPGWGNPLHLE